MQVRVLSPLPPPDATTHYPPPSSSVENRENVPTVLTGMRNYLQESWAELKKVAWPTRETVVRLTLLVVAVSVVIGVYIYVLDRIFNTLVDQVI